LDAIELARQRLEWFAAEKIIAKAVESIFGTTAVEHQRWTNDA
jgi:hypothetical protein